MALDLNALDAPLRGEQFISIPLPLSLAVLADFFREAECRVDDTSVLSTDVAAMSPAHAELVGFIAQAMRSRFGANVLVALLDMPKGMRPKFSARMLSRWLAMCGHIRPAELVPGAKPTVRQELLLTWLLALSVKVVSKERMLSKLKMIDSSLAMANAILPGTGA